MKNPKLKAQAFAAPWCKRKMPVCWILAQYYPVIWYEFFYGVICLVGYNCIIGLINLSALLNHLLISLIGVINFGFIGSIALSVSTASSANWLICLVCLVGLSTH
jgi:hypothetical protein